MKALLQSAFGPHPASTLVALVVVLLAVRLGIRFLRGERLGGERPEGRLVDAFFSGVLLVNALAHFTHGVSGEDFPAPFGYLLGPGFLSNLSNVLWGFVNLALGYSLLVASRAFGPNKRGAVAFFAGVLAMGVLLSYVFSR